jgi:hypothetical protein
MIDLGSLAGASLLGLFILSVSSVYWSLRLQADCQRKLERMKSLLDINNRQAEAISSMGREFLDLYTRKDDA